MQAGIQPVGSLICDLDGVLFRGDQPIAGSGEALHKLDQAGWQLLFCTNNSTRPVAGIQARISSLTGYEPGQEQIVSSAHAAAEYLRTQQPRTRVVGGEGIHEALQAAAVPIVQEPKEAQTVLVGLARDFSYQLLEVLGAVIREGAELVATNIDPTFPTATGLAPGAGALVVALETVSGKKAVVVGKPYHLIRDLLRKKLLGGGPVWVVGDREDTDLALGWLSGWRTALVLSGVTTSREELSGAPSLVVEDLASLARHLIAEV